MLWQMDSYLCGKSIECLFRFVLLPASSSPLRRRFELRRGSALQSLETQSQKNWYPALCTLPYRVTEPSLVHIMRYLGK